MKKYIALFMAVCIVAAGSSVFGAMEFERSHISLATLKNGKADYSDARFGNVEFSLTNEDVPVTKEAALRTGTMTLSGGNYSFWNGKEMQKVSGTPMTYKLGLKTWLASGDEEGYQPFTDAGGEMKVGIEADSGLSGVNVSWNFPDNPSINGSVTFPKFLTTQEQLDNCVLYFEFIRSGDVVTGINWRVVKASDTSTPVPQNFRMRFNRFEIWNYNEDKLLNSRPQIWIEAGINPEGIYEFDTPIKESDIWCVRTRFFTYDYDTVMGCLHMWNYYTQIDPDMYLWKRHASDALLVNGKSDYSSAKFSNVFFEAENRNSITIEAKHFTDAGRMTVPGGGYVVKDWGTGETLETVSAGTDKTFALKIYENSAITDTYLEYTPVDDSGRWLTFGGEAETTLPGKTILWTFPEEMNLANGSGVIPTYRTTAEQLASGVPYVEVVSKDGYITAINYKIVTSSDTTTAIKPPYRTDFSFMIFHDTTRRNRDTNTYSIGTARNTASGTYTLDEPQPVDTMKQLRVRLLTYESADNPAVYQWWFTPAEAPAPITITTSTLPSGTVNSPYTATLAANVSGATWEISSGSLPAGLTLNSSTGAITGMPTAEGTSTFTVKAASGSQSAEKTLSITVTQSIIGIGSSGGGCESFFSVSYLAILAAFVLRKSRR